MVYAKQCTLQYIGHRITYIMSMFFLMVFMELQTFSSVDRFRQYPSLASSSAPSLPVVFLCPVEPATSIRQTVSRNCFTKHELTNGKSRAVTEGTLSVAIATRRDTSRV